MPYFATGLGLGVVALCLCGFVVRGAGLCISWLDLLLDVHACRRTSGVGWAGCCVPAGSNSLGITFFWPKNFDMNPLRFLHAFIILFLSFSVGAGFSLNFLAVSSFPAVIACSCVIGETCFFVFS